MKTFFIPTLIRITIFLGLILIAVFSVSERTFEPPSSDYHRRALASVSRKKHTHSHHDYNRNLPIRHTEKLLAPVAIVVEPHGPAATQAGDEFELRVTIKSRYDLSSLETEWILPQGVELKLGSLKDTLYSIKSNEVRVVHAIFQQMGGNNEQIHFRVKSLDSHLPFGASIQYNSLDQSDIDESIAALEKRARAYMKDQKAKVVK